MEELGKQATYNCIIQAVEQSAVMHADQVALYEEKTGRSFTYSQLLTLADKLSNVLKQKILYPKKIEIGDETPLVAFLTERSLVSIVCILAILKARAAYVPVDPSFPADRQQHILEHSKCQIALVDRANMSRLDEIRQIVPVTILLDNVTGEIDEMDESKRFETQDPPSELLELTDKSLAYVLYTSGSTGKPKGVMVTNRGLWNVVHYFVDLLNISNKDRVLGLTTLCFDISMLEVFMPLISGACLVLITVSTQKNPMKLIQGVTSTDWGGRITIMQATPTTYEMLISCGWHGDANISFLVGGEACRPKVAALAPHCKAFYNVYGPTETTIWSSSYLLPKNPELIDAVSSNISVGTPIWKTMFYVVDESGKDITSSGEEGELWIGGDGVALGYLHAPELTTARFFKNPFDYGEMYRTGDVFRCLPDGNFVFVRRLDDQVKVNGYRIELGEVEIAIAADERVEQAVVIVKENVLIAFIHLLNEHRNAFNDHKTMSTELAKVAGRRLPPYMIPKFFVEVDSFPTTANGKLDRLTMSKQLNLESLNAEESLNLIQDSNGEDEIICAEETMKDKTRSSPSCSSMTEFVRAQVIKMTGDRQVSIKVGFAAFGIDSITAMMFRSRLSQSLKGCKVDANDLYDPDATIETFSVKLFDRLKVENPQLLKELGIFSAKEPEGDREALPSDIESGLSMDGKEMNTSSAELDRLALYHRPLIEGLRGVATILVLIDHFFWFPLVGGARIRVDTLVFIIISGFTTGLTDVSHYLRYLSKTLTDIDNVEEKQNLYYLSSWSPWNFLYSKFIGLFPLYWLVIVLSIPVMLVNLHYSAGEYTGIMILYITGLEQWTSYTTVLHHVYYVSLLWSIFIVYSIFKTILIAKKEWLSPVRKAILIVILIVILVIAALSQTQLNPGVIFGYFVLGIITAALLHLFLQQRKKNHPGSASHKWNSLNWFFSAVRDDYTSVPIDNGPSPLPSIPKKTNVSPPTSSTSLIDRFSWYLPCLIADFTTFLFLMGIFFNDFDSIGQNHSSVLTPRYGKDQSVSQNYHDQRYQMYDLIMLNLGLPILFAALMLSHFLVPLDRLQYCLSYLLIAKNRFFILLGECSLSIYICQRLFFDYYYYWLIEGIVHGEFPYSLSFMKSHLRSKDPAGGYLRQHVWVFWIGLFLLFWIAVFLQKFFQEKFVMWIITSNSDRNSSSKKTNGGLNWIRRLCSFDSGSERMSPEKHEFLLNPDGDNNT